MSTKHEKMMNRIANHGKKLNAIFHTELDPVELCKKLHRIEAKQTRNNTDYSNGRLDGEEWEKETEKTHKAVIKLLGDKVPIYINGDPRGYSLKIDDSLVREQKLDIMTDLGGYGLLAPDLTED